MRFVKPSAILSAAVALWVASSLCGATALLEARPRRHASAREEKPGASAQAAPSKTTPQVPEKKTTPAKAPKKAPAKAAAQTPSAGFRRDPFQPLISKAEPGKVVPENLPPGPGGLVVSTLRLEGIVRAPSGMIAVVSNPQGRVYFIREGAALYDGTVEKIGMDSITMREKGKDPFGKVIERQVVKRLYPRAGEQ